jgi:hypothetical protein
LENGKQNQLSFVAVGSTHRNTKKGASDDLFGE